MTSHKLYFTLMLIHFVNLVGSSTIHYLEYLDTLQL